MAALHEALSALSPTDWKDIPHDGLNNYMQNLFESGELICNSVPSPPQGVPFEESRPHHLEPNTARSHKEMHPSTSRSPAPHESHEELKSRWGKPLKFSAKDNPLNIVVYKMAGNDRHGAWFARRSVHEGIGFQKFQTAMRREFPETLSVEGGAGAGSIRGIGGDRRLEHVDVEGVGRLEVFQLSAQFPGPVAPREFITLLITGETALSEKSGAEVNGQSPYLPRHLMTISKPIKHPDAPERSGYVLGQYESVELIREIPLHRLASRSEGASPLASGTTPRTTNGNSEALDQENDLGRADAGEISTNPELNPVEWIMITRSDPGGGIPRFMVERGTPSTMIGDVHKFLDWAANYSDVTYSADTTSEKTVDESSGEAAKNPGSHDAEPVSGIAEASTSTLPDPGKAQANTTKSGLMQALEAGLDNYAPTMVSSYVHEKLVTLEPREDSSDSSETSSVGSFLSASEMRRLSDISGLQRGSSESISADSGHSTQLGAEKGEPKKKLSQHEAKLLKLTKEKEKRERKMAQKRADEEEKLKRAQQDEESGTQKAHERFQKEMKKSEDRHKRELEKLELKKEREARKAEERRKKQSDRDTLSRITRERDEFKSQLDLLKKENALLHDQVGNLQKENTGMAAKIGKTLGAASNTSITSRSSGDSKESGEGMKDGKH